MIGTKKTNDVRNGHFTRTVFKQIRYEINSLLENELSRNEFLILNLLREQGAKKVTEFASILGVSASHITAVTDTLVEKGWITQYPLKRGPPHHQNPLNR